MLCMSMGITIVPQRLTQKREKQGLSQRGLADLVAKRVGRRTFEQSNISGYERGTKTPSLPVFRALAQILETNMEWLAGETDDDKPSSDLEDQVIIGIEDPAEREMLQEMMSLLADASSDERRYVAGLVRRLLLAPAPPRPRVGRPPSGPRRTRPH